MALHFAYGSNMSRALMGARCRDAAAIGIAVLSGWRFVINPEGFGSIAPRPGGCVHGVLWRLSARDLAAINAYESVDSGLYLRRRLPRSEEHTSELQSLRHLVCRLLLEKKKDQ